ncbi:MAG TPA: hypothetical protein VF192_06420 [Longimicrobiales bacterium]
MSHDAVARRVAAVVGGVVRQAVVDARAAGVVLLDDGSAEARLAGAWCRAALGPERFWAVPAPPASAAEALAAAAPGVFPAAALAAAPAEVHRLAGRLVALGQGALLAHPANKTELLLSSRMPPEPLLPLGDLYASEVERLAGSWSASPEVAELAARAGGIAALDRALAALLEERRPPEAALASLPAGAGRAVLSALEAGRFAHRRVGLVPKLSRRTLGVDYFA